MPGIAVLSDVHGNSPALQAVLNDIDRSGCERIFVLGDIFNGIDPGGCVDMLRNRSDSVCLKGNAELYLQVPHLDEFSKRDDPDYAGVIRILKWFHAHLTPDQINWLDQLPLTLDYQGWFMIHDSPLDRLEAQSQDLEGIDEIYRELLYHGQGINPSMTESSWLNLADWMSENRYKGIFCGHTHEPFYRDVGEWFICNTGSAGLPLDGDPRGCWSMVVMGENGIPIIEMNRVAYDVDATIEMIKATPDYETPQMLRAYEQMVRTGIHWKMHLNR